MRIKYVDSGTVTIYLMNECLTKTVICHNEEPQNCTANNKIKKQWHLVGIRMKRKTYHYHFELRLLEIRTTRFSSIACFISDLANVHITILTTEEVQVGSGIRFKD